MKIIVCIKQVPYIDQLKFDHATRRVIREGVQSEINPFDKRDHEGGRALQTIRW
jgi:electron transfer flavoprotein beta subunit